MAAKIGKRLTTLPLLIFLPLFLSCSVEGPAPVTTYERIVIDTYEPHGGFPAGFPADTYLGLYDASGNLLAADDDGNTDSGQSGSSRIDYITGLTSGTYYIKVTLGFSSLTLGAYAVRVLSLTPAEAIPAYPPDFDITIDLYESMDAPETELPLSITPASIDVGTDDFGRILDPAADVDWLRFTLP